MSVVASVSVAVATFRRRELLASVVAPLLERLWILESFARLLRQLELLHRAP